MTREMSQARAETIVDAWWMSGSNPRLTNGQAMDLSARISRALVEAHNAAVDEAAKDAWCAVRQAAEKMDDADACGLMADFAESAVRDLHIPTELMPETSQSEEKSNATD